MANPQSIQQGIETRDKIVELVAQDRDAGGDGLTRAQLAAALNISKPSLLRHMQMLLAENRVKQESTRVTPADQPHTHICRTCGQSFH